MSRKRLKTEASIAKSGGAADSSDGAESSSDVDDDGIQSVEVVRIAISFNLFLSPSVSLLLILSFIRRHLHFPHPRDVRCDMTLVLSFPST